MMCNNCAHNPVCELWRKNECQDASCYAESADGGCALYLPAANVIEVVLCKDCKHYSAYSRQCGHPDGLWLTVSADDGYCSYGEPQDKN